MQCRLSHDKWWLCDCSLSQLIKRKEACFSNTAHYLAAGGHTFWQTVLATVRLDNRWGTTTNDVENRCTCLGSDIYLATGQREAKVSFDKSLKNSSQGLYTPFRFNILAQLAKIPARITLHELLRLSKKWERHSGMRLLIQNLFWHKYPQSIPMTTRFHVPNVIWYK